MTTQPAPGATDHPRSRGVYASRAGEAAKRVGSSPLARGLLSAGRARLREARIIPARAGFTSPYPAQPTNPSDHPRSRGVYRYISTASHSSRWIIPARAGFTRSSPRTRGEAADHPRSRGVYDRIFMHMIQVTGSSPLARGLRGLDVQGVGRQGIIPARAGFTRSCTRAGSSGPDHPRSRGGYLGEIMDRLLARGSSPLARGLRNWGTICAPGTRIIPARAGFTYHV